MKKSNHWYRRVVQGILVFSRIQRSLQKDQTMKPWIKVDKGIWKSSDEPNYWKVIARLRINGRIAHRQETFHGTKEQAKEKFESFKKELRACKKSACSLKSIPQPRTLKELLTIYQDKRGAVSRWHSKKIEMLKRELGDVALGEFADRFESFLRLLRNTPMRFKRKDIKPRMRTAATINRRVEIVRAAFKLGIALEVIKSNPITKERFPRLKEIPRDIVLTENDRKGLLNTIDKEAPHISALLRFALSVPCRRSELVNMRKDDLDLFNNTIRVRNGTTKNDIGCWKPIPPDQLEYFRNLPKETDYLFYKKVKDNYLPLGSFRSPWRRCLKLAGLQGFRLHDTRHISASALVNNGTPEQVVMTVANWKTNMLRNYYHREPIKALELVRFSPPVIVGCDSSKAAGM